jgi:hypothetical protein
MAGTLHEDIYFRDNISMSSAQNDKYFRHIFGEHQNTDFML